MRNNISGILECDSSCRPRIDDMRKMVSQEKGRVVDGLSLVIAYKDSMHVPPTPGSLLECQQES